MVVQKNYYCKVCNIDIKKAGYSPVYDEELDDVICSGCCLIAIGYHLNMISVLYFESLPEYTKKYCIEFHKKELEKEKLKNVIV